MPTNEEFWKMFVQVLGYGATAAICLYLVLQFILKWKTQERTRKPENGNNYVENGNGGKIVEMSKLVSAIVQPLLTETTEKLEKAIEEHHDYVRDRHEQMTLTLQQITQIQGQQIEILKELTKVIRTVNAQQGRFFDAVASLDRFGKLFIQRREEDSSSQE